MSEHDAATTAVTARDCKDVTPTHRPLPSVLRIRTTHRVIDVDTIRAASKPAAGRASRRPPRRPWPPVAGALEKERRGSGELWAHRRGDEVEA
ncbi:hypothetical protein GCM10023320_84340 [Pseudonocardia adelaidensis]|uniref:Uncharacterized protein n=1 Tax=Pseudonocardia adelaidensis TaxID=648754 RepID=A0ABP9PGQ9_9PSEU